MGRSLHAGCYRFEFRRSPHRSLHRGKRSRYQQRVADVLHELSVRLGVGTDRDPVGVGEECTPAVLALSHAVPREHVSELLVALADQRRPEPGLADAMLFPNP